MPFSRAIWVEVGKSALTHNVAQVKKRARGQGLIAVVKANAYGHGLAGTALALRDAGVSQFAVASLGEGLELRDAGIGKPQSGILILGYSLPSHADEVVASGLCQTVISVHEIRSLAGAAERLNKKAHVQIKIDTGMHRLGAPPGDFPRLMDALRRFPSVVLDGVYTHYSSADVNDSRFTEQQYELFGKTIEPFKLPETVRLHASNSSALINCPSLKLNDVRVGIALFGEYASPEVPKILDLKPVLRLKSRIAEVKALKPGDGAGYGHRFINQSGSPCRLGIIPVGYADGFLRHSSGKREVLIRGRRCRVVGAVSMDFAHILLPDDLSIGVGEPVTLIGTDGKDHIGAEELARVLDTIVYEILTLIPTRIPRRYVD
ncbi:MAG TPA: alanine racemase [Firmicutes bacterium]|nr:alanine racemase [Bacillota bacterium]